MSKFVDKGIYLLIYVLSFCSCFEIGYIFGDTWYAVVMSAIVIILAHNLVTDLKTTA